MMRCNPDADRSIEKAVPIDVPCFFLISTMTWGSSADSFGSSFPGSVLETEGGGCSMLGLNCVDLVAEANRRRRRRYSSSRGLRSTTIRIAIAR